MQPKKAANIHTDKKMRREYVQNIRNSFYEENGMQKRETREVDDSAPEMGLAAALKLCIFFLYVYLQLF